MTDTFQLKIYWDNRQEAARECAVRLACMLEGLAPINAAFARWNKQATTPSKANAPFCAMPPRIDELAAAFEKGISRKDVPPKRPWPERGFSVSAWNGRNDSHDLFFIVHAGAYASHLPCPNAVELYLPRQNGENADLINPVTIAAILKELIAAWQPLWGGVFSITYRKLRLPPLLTGMQRLERRPLPPPSLFSNPGWVVYLSAPYARLFVAPSSGHIEDLPDGGILASTAGAMSSSENPRDLAAADELDTALKLLQTNVRARP
jgi:hypothetical protein